MVVDLSGAWGKKGGERKAASERGPCGKQGSRYFSLQEVFRALILGALSSEFPLGGGFKGEVYGSRSKLGDVLELVQTQAERGRLP